MQNFEKKNKKQKNKDLATSPDIRVVVETLFFLVILFFRFLLVRSSRKEEVVSQSANLRRTKHCEDDNFAVLLRRLCSSGWRILQFGLDSKQQTLVA